MTNFVSKNLLHIAKRHVIPPAEMSQIFQTGATKNKFIGALPPEIIKNIPAQHRGTVTQRADSVFSDFAQSVAHISVSGDTHYTYYNESLKKYFSPIVYGLNSVLNRDDTEISYIGSGTFKHCFLISFGQDSSNRYVLQTFQNKINFDPDNFPHGVLYEPQNYFTTYKKYSHGRVARPFMAHPSTKEVLSDGYILVKYIDSNHPIKQQLGRFTKQRTNMINTDTHGQNNTIRGIAIDTGGFVTNPLHIAAHKTRNDWHELAQVLNNINFSKEMKDVYLILDKIYGKYGNTFFDTTFWPKFLQKFPGDKRDTVRKTLKSLQRLKLKIEKIHTNPEWATLQQYIFDDIKHVALYDYGNFVFYSEIINDILRFNQR